MFKTFLNSYFGFTKQQRNGLAVLISISCCLALIRLLYPYFLEDPLVELKYLPPTEEQSSNSFPQQDSTKSEPFVFDPNTVSFEKLIVLGFSEKSAKALLNFRKKGFVFRQASDLKKVYGVSEELYQNLEAYVLIDNTNPSTAKQEKISPVSGSVSKTTRSTSMELNSADSAGLISVKGIGPVYARRILKYRNLLGGFYQLEQLKEVYGFSEETFQHVKDNFRVDAKLIKPLKINSDDFKTLNKHPYLSYELTGSIFNLRRKKTLNSEDVKTLVNDEVLYQKLVPYLRFD